MVNMVLSLKSDELDEYLMFTLGVLTHTPRFIDTVGRIDGSSGVRVLVDEEDELGIMGDGLIRL